MEDQAIWGDVKFNKDEVKSRCDSFKEEFICYFVTRLGEFETESRSSKLGLVSGEGKEGKWQKISTGALTEGASAAAIPAGKFRVIVSTGSKCISLLIKLGFKVNHQKKAKANTAEFAISERSLLSCVSEAATELSHIYEYQISMIKNPNDVKVLAQHAADCIFSYCNEQTKDEENNRVGFLITGVIKGTSDKDNKKSKLETRCGLTWTLASIFKKPSLIEQLPFGSTENKPCALYNFFKKDNARPKKYGYRKQALCVDDESHVYRVMEFDKTDQYTEDRKDPNHPEDFMHQVVIENNPPVFVRVDYSDVKNYCEKITDESFNDYIKSIHAHPNDTVVACLRPVESFNENAKIELRKRADFSNCDLTRLKCGFFDIQTPVSDADSTDADNPAKLCFKGANLFKANLSGKDLSGVNLQGADLSYGNYENTDFRRAILLKTCITYSEVNGAHFNKDDYQNVACVDLHGSNVKDTALFNQLQSVDDKASKLLEKQEEGFSQMTQGMKTLQEGIQKLIPEDKKGDSDEEEGREQCASTESATGEDEASTEFDINQEGPNLKPLPAMLSTANLPRPPAAPNAVAAAAALPAAINPGMTANNREEGWEQRGGTESATGEDDASTEFDMNQGSVKGNVFEFDHPNGEKVKEVIPPHLLAEHYDYALLFVEDDRDEALDFKHWLDGICSITGVTYDAPELSWKQSANERCEEAVKRSTSLIVYLSEKLLEAYQSYKKNEAKLSDSKIKELKQFKFHLNEFLFKTVDDETKCDKLFPVFTKKKSEFKNPFPYGIGSLEGVSLDNKYKEHNLERHFNSNKSHKSLRKDNQDKDFEKWKASIINRAYADRL